MTFLMYTQISRGIYLNEHTHGRLEHEFAELGTLQAPQDYYNSCCGIFEINSGRQTTIEIVYNYND